MITHRYILREFAAPFAVVLLCVTLIMFLSQLFRIGDIALVSLQAGDAFLRLFTYVVPSFLVMTIPGSLLLAALISFGRLTQDREIDAWLATGRRPLSLLLGPSALSLGLTLLVASLTLVGEPWGVRQFRDDMGALAKQALVSSMSPRMFNESIEGVTIYFDERDDAGQLHNVLLYDSRTKDSQDLVVARRGTVRIYEDAKRLRFDLIDGEVHRQGQDGERYVVAHFDEISLVIDIHFWVKRMTRYFHPFFGYGLGELRKQMREEKRTDLARKMEVHLHKKFALPVTCLLFPWIGLSLALRRDARTRSVGYILGMTVVMGYHGVLRAAENLATATPEGIPVWPLVWAPTVIAALVLAVVARWWSQ